MSTPRVRVATTARRIGLALAVTVLTVTALGTAAGASDDPVTTTVNKLLYAVSDPLCGQPVQPGVMRCFGWKRVQVKRGTRNAYAYRPAVAAGPTGGYTPSTLARVYNYNPKINQSTTTVAVVLWYDAPDVLADLNHFDAHYGLRRETSTSFRKVNETGAASPLPRANADTAGEIALDTQAVRAVCNTCRILLVEAKAPTAGDLAVAENTAARLGAKVITNSYGTPESPLPASIVNAYHHPGIAITVSTGDDGWFGWDYANNNPDDVDGAASFPASSPDVVAVGGTTLKLTSAGHRASETVWNGNGAHDATGRSTSTAMGASGGGCSTLYPAKPWQAHYPGYAAAKCNGKRLTADLALDADPETGFDVYDSYGSGGWVTIGGTSLSAPLAAGMFGLVGGANNAGYPSSALYTHAAVTPSEHFDVTSGGNGFCQADSTPTCSNAVYQPGLLTPGNHNPNGLGLGVVDCSYPRSGSDVATTPARNPECNATSGYDGASGIGSPASLALFTRSEPAVSIVVPKSVRRARSAAFSANVQPAVGATTIRQLLWNWGDGKTTSTTAKATHHTYAKAGRYTVALTVTDSRYQVVFRRTTVTVGA